MSRYDPIALRLKTVNSNIVPMTFKEIEQIIQGQLPASARKFRAWWSNDSATHTQAAAWLSAGYSTERVDMKDETLVFRRVKNSNPPSPREGDGSAKPKKPFRHPVFGCMAGTVTIADDVDLTEPAMPEWAEMVEEKYGKNDPDFT